jgi:hypothetical protein
MLSNARQRLRTGTLPLTLRGVAIGLALMVMSISLAACAAASANGQSATPTPHPRQCGRLTIGASGLPGNGPEAAQAENCFWQAFRQCQPATLSVTAMGVDAGAVRTFTITGTAGACKITDVRQTYVISTNKQITETFTCAGLVQHNGGLLFQSCGDDGDIAVPAPTQ